jgi:hypothetical protein
MSTCVYLHYGTTGCIKPPTFFDKMRMSDEVKRQLESGFGDLRKVVETTSRRTWRLSGLVKNFFHPMFFNSNKMNFSVHWINAQIEDFDLGLLVDAFSRTGACLRKPYDVEFFMFAQVNSEH